MILKGMRTKMMKTNMEQTTLMMTALMDIIGTIIQLKYRTFVILEFKVAMEMIMTERIMTLLKLMKN